MGATVARIALSLPPTRESVRTVRAVADVTLARLGVAEPSRADLLLALCEACTNVVRHAAATVCRVTLTIAGRRCAVEVSDDGTGFRPHLPPDPPPADADGGRGLWLIDQIADDLRITATPGGGTRLRFATTLRYAGRAPVEFRGEH